MFKEHGSLQPGTAGMSCVSPRPLRVDSRPSLLLLHPGLPPVPTSPTEAQVLEHLGSNVSLALSEVKLPNLCVPQFPTWNWV